MTFCWAMQWFGIGADRPVNVRGGRGGKVQCLTVVVVGPTYGHKWLLRYQVESDVLRSPEGLSFESDSSENSPSVTRGILGWIRCKRKLLFGNKRDSRLNQIQAKIFSVTRGIAAGIRFKRKSLPDHKTDSLLNQMQCRFKRKIHLVIDGRVSLESDSNENPSCDRRRIFAWVWCKRESLLWSIGDFGLDLIQARPPLLIEGGFSLESDSSETPKGSKSN